MSQACCIISSIYFQVVLLRPEVGMLSVESWGTIEVSYLGLLQYVIYSILAY